MTTNDEDFEDEIVIPPLTNNSVLDVYTLYYGEETGGREDCSIFYTDLEVWASLKGVRDREKALIKANKHVDEFYTHVSGPFRVWRKE